MTKISRLRPVDGWPAHVSKAASGLAGLGLLLLPLLTPAEQPLHRHRTVPAKVDAHLAAATAASPSPAGATAPPAAPAARPLIEPPATAQAIRPDNDKAQPASAASPHRHASLETSPQRDTRSMATRVADNPPSYPAPVAEPIAVVPSLVTVATADPRSAPTPLAALPRPAATDAGVAPSVAVARVAPVKRRRPEPAPEPPDVAAAKAKAAADSPPPQPATSATGQTTSTGTAGAGPRLPPHLAQPPAAADPSLPSPAAPLPPDSWSTAEIDASRQECAALLGPLDAEVEHVAAFRTGLCGAPAPVKLQRLGVSHKVEMQPAALTNCRVVAGLADWVEETLQPAAQEAFGSPVARIVGASSYACRNRYNNPDQRISEHAFANAVDISAFVLADGRRIDVKSNWGPTARDARAAAKALVDAAAASKGEGPASKSPEKPATTPTIASAELKPSRTALEQRTAWKSDGLQKLGAPPPKAALPVMPADAGESATPPATAQSRFLHRLHAGACQIFSTVLGPEANEAHRDYFHFDMKDRARRSLCE